MFDSDTHDFELKCILDQTVSDPLIFGDKHLRTVKETLYRHSEGRKTRTDRDSGGNQRSKRQVRGSGHRRGAFKR